MQVRINNDTSIKKTATTTEITTKQHKLIPYVPFLFWFIKNLANALSTYSITNPVASCTTTEIGCSTNFPTTGLFYIMQKTSHFMKIIE